MPLFVGAESSSLHLATRNSDYTAVLDERNGTTEEGIGLDFTQVLGKVYS